ncbi:MAG TPA: hypothetical protein VH593_22265 [Ktedonobacteraceae bacterium]
MKYYSMLLHIVCASVVLFLLSACSTTVEQGNQNGAGSTPMSGKMSAAHPALPVQEIHVSIAGNQQTILADARGFALYFYLPDTPTKTACTGGCALAWPPLLAHNSSAVKSTAALPGKLAVQQTANGNQVEYNQHFLYTYLGDHAPGQVTGNGVSSWYVATPDLTAPSL